MARAATPAEDRRSAAHLMQQPPLLILAGCIVLFHLANAAMLPLMGSVVTMRSSEWATVLIAACIVVPQLVVAAFSPWVGRQARDLGTTAVAAIGFAALPIRGLLFATVTDPYLLVVVQVLDGVTAAVLGVMVPLMIADLTRGTGHFNSAQGSSAHDWASARRSARRSPATSPTVSAAPPPSGARGNRGDRICRRHLTDAGNAAAHGQAS